MRRLILALLLMPLLLGQAYNVPFNPPAAAPPASGWSTPVLEDFNRADEFLPASANWVMTDPAAPPDTNKPRIVSGILIDAATATAFVGVWVTDTFTAYQCGCLEFREPTTQGYPSAVFRKADTTTASDDLYVLRTNNGASYVPRACNGPTCSDFGTAWTQAITTGDYYCACVNGASTATEFAVWHFESTATPTPEDEDPTDWGNPSHCWCPSGSCALDDGTGGEWGDCTGNITARDLPGGGYSWADCSGDACYMGVYNGSAGGFGIDNISLRDYTP